MADHERSAYELDMAAEAESVLRFAASALPAELQRIDLRGYQRIVLTGMGGSDCASIPFELSLAGAGLPVWRVLTGRLLEMLPLLTPDTLLVITSQSGRSGEVVALLDRLERRPRTILGLTDDPESPLAAAADHLIALRSGREATVATKSFANTLAAFHRLSAIVLGKPDGAAVEEIRVAAASLQRRIDTGDPAIEALAQRFPGGATPRLALVGNGPDATTALAGAMVLKEAAKVAAEGYTGGAFRHGPFELAGPGLTALLFGRGSPEEASPNALARDTAATGSTVVSVAPRAYEGSELIAVPGSSDLERLLHGMYVVQQVSVALARRAGLTPGAFLYGQKITAQL